MTTDHHDPPEVPPIERSSATWSSPRPPGTDDLSEEQLAGLVTRDAMIGVARL